MSEWLVPLEGHKFDLEELPRWFTSPDLEVIEEEGNYYLKSNEFNSFSESSEVRERAEELLQDINGAAKIYSSEYRPINIGSLIKIDENGIRHHYKEVKETINVRGKGYVEVTKADTSEGGQESREIIPVESWVAKAKQDRIIKKVLRFWSTEKISWFNLYNILEAIEEDIDCEVHEKGWASNNEVNRFTHTANCYSVLGLESRHGRDFEPPSKPIDLSDAISLIRKITNNWLREKLKL